MGLSFLIMFAYKLITATTVYIDTLDKVSGFECGSSPFSESRSKFFIKFYLVAVIFLLFDLEIVLLFPLVPILLNTVLLNSSIFGVFIIFILMIWLGIYYEFKKNILDWF
jgi:NADH:ubiquinone oxidoreductase subunit 3 (subunit A)